MISAEPRLVEAGRGYTVTYKGKYLYSPRHPQKTAVRRSERIEIAPNTLIFVPSLGLGYGLVELLTKLPQHCHVLCVELDEKLFKLALDSGVNLPKSEKLTIIRIDRPQQAAAAVHPLGLWHFRRLLPLHLSGGYQLYRDKYRAVQQALEEEIHLFWQNKLTLVAMSRLWLKNLFTNLSLLPRAQDMAALGTAAPILVAGAGASLEKSMDSIMKIRDRLTVMAVDTSLPALVSAGIVPDLVFTMEAQIYNLEDFLPFHDPDLKILCDLTANPQTLRLFPRLYFYSSRFYPLSLFSRLERNGLLPTCLSPRGSVGVAAVEAALLLTRGPVLITGLDFSYPNKLTHARGTPTHLRLHSESSRTRPGTVMVFEALLKRPRLYLEDKAKNRILTDLVLQSYAAQLRRIVKTSDRVFDLGPTGLPLGAPSVRSVTELDRICAASQEGQREPPSQAGLRATEAASADVKNRLLAFCEQELQLLERAAQCIGEYSRWRAPEGGLPAELKETEYLFLSLAEADPQRLVSPNNLAAAAAAARLFSSTIEHTRGTLRSRTWPAAPR